jgi:hypothetical protein
MTWRILVPLALGLGAGLLNFVLIRGVTTPLELVAVSKEVKVGEELKEEMLEKVSVRAPRELLATAVLWSERGTIVRARVGRTLQKHELVLGPDVRHDLSDDIKNELRPGEACWTLLVRPDRLAPGLRLHDAVLIRAAGKDTNVPAETFGPFRFLGLGERSLPFHSPTTVTRQEFIKVAVAAPILPNGSLSPDVAAFDLFCRKVPDEEKLANTLRVEHYRQSGKP